VAFWIGAACVATAIATAATVLESVAPATHQAPGDSDEAAYSEAA
jgi:hypothetical protein